MKLKKLSLLIGVFLLGVGVLVSTLNSGPPALPVGLNLTGSVSLKIDQLEQLSLVDKSAKSVDSCQKELGSQVLLVADSVMTVDQLLNKSILSVDGALEVDYLFLTVEPIYELDLAGRRSISDKPYFVVSKALANLFPRFASAVVSKKYLLSPGQVLFVSFTQDVEYCAANSSVDLDIESDGFHLAFLENDLNDFVVSSDALSAVKVLGLWRTNLVSNLEIDSDDFSQLPAGFYWLQTEFIKSEDQAVAYLKSLLASKVSDVQPDLNNAPADSGSAVDPADPVDPPQEPMDPPEEQVDEPEDPADSEDPGNEPDPNSGSDPDSADPVDPGSDPEPDEPDEGSGTVDPEDLNGGVVLLDMDEDGVIDELDSCPSTPGTLNGCPDEDGDLVADADDNCPANDNPDQADADNDGTGDACDNQDNSDNDDDGRQNFEDNCLDTANATQNNFDGDELGNACDSDVDNDGVVDFDVATQKVQDLCLFTSRDVASEDLTEFGCVDSDGDDAIDLRDDNRILLSEFLQGHGDAPDLLRLAVDNCVDLENLNQLDFDNDGLGDACDDLNDLDFNQMITKIIDPDNCGVGESVPESYIKNDSRPFAQYPIRHAINHGERSFISFAPLYDRIRSQQILERENPRTLRIADVFFPDFALYNEQMIDGLQDHVDAVWSAPNVIQWINQVAPQFDWMKIGTGNVSSVFYSDRTNHPQWIDSLNFDYLNTSKPFKLAYTDMEPSLWAMEVETSSQSLPIKSKVSDYLPEFEGKLPVFYTNDVVFRTEVRAGSDSNGNPFIDLDPGQRSNLQKLLLSPLIELKTMPENPQQKAFMFSTNCNQRPKTSEITYFQRYAQNSSDFDHIEMEFDRFSSARFDSHLERMIFKTFGFDQTPLFEEQTSLRSGLDEMAFEYFSGFGATDVFVDNITTTHYSANFPTRAFVRGCGDRNLSSNVDGAYDPRIFVSDDQNGWNLLIADNNLKEFTWALDDNKGAPIDALPDGIGVCPDEFEDCDFVQAHACDQEDEDPYVVMFKDLIDLSTINKTLKIAGMTCLVPDPSKPGASLAVADALSTLASDYELDAMSSDDYTAPNKRKLGESKVNPTFGLNPTWRRWFANDLDAESANELFYMLGVGNGTAKASLYEAPAIQEETRLVSWADLAIDVRQELMCTQDDEGETFMSHKFWNPNVSSLGHSVVMGLLEFAETLPANSAKLGSNVDMVAEKFLKIFATGYWDEKWSRGTVTDLDTSDGYFSWLKLLSANYASDNGYMVIANNFFMFWNELLSFDTMRAGEDLRFQPSAYSLENSLAEYLLVQNEAAPMLASPYRYKQGAGNVPDNIQNIFNYFKQVIDTPDMREEGDTRVAPMDTWMSRIMNYEYGTALGDAYVYRLDDVGIDSPNAYILAREYEKAVIIKNFSTRELQLDASSLRPDKTWVRLVGVPLVEASGLSDSYQMEAASSQLFCGVGEKQDLAFMLECAANIGDGGQQSPGRNSACFVACNSQKEYMAQRNMINLNQRAEYLAMDDNEYIEPLWLMEVSRDTVVRAGQSVILFDLDTFGPRSSLVDELGEVIEDRYDAFKPDAFCINPVPLEPLADGISFDAFSADYANNFRRAACLDLFELNPQDMVQFSLKSGSESVNSSCGAVDYLDLKCILENVMSLDNEYFKQMELERLDESGDE